jgi:hypothetical protein
MQQLAHLSLSFLLQSSSPFETNALKSISPVAALKSIMRHDTSVYDAVIHLRADYCARAGESIDYPSFNTSKSNKLFPLIREQYKNAVKRPLMPADGSAGKNGGDEYWTGLEGIGFDPVGRFMEELQACFGESALFLHNSHGGMQVGMVMRPAALIPQPFKVAINGPVILISDNNNNSADAKSSSSKKRQLLNGKTAKSTKPFIKQDLTNILQQIASIGQGIIERIEMKLTTTQ